MTLNPRRRQRTDSNQEEAITTGQTDDRGILIQISNQLGTVIDKLDRIATMLEDKNSEEVMKAEFKETRETIQQGFSTITTYAISANNVLVQKDKENLKSQIKSWRNDLNERKKGYWSFLRTENISKKYEG